MGNRNSGVEFTVGLTLGIVVGIVAGLLLAPQPGEKTRRMLKDKATDVAERAREITTDPEKVYRETWKERKEQHDPVP